MGRLIAGRLIGCALVGALLLSGCSSTEEKPEKSYEQLRAEAVAEFMLHLNNRSETERHRDGLVEVGLRSPEDRAYVVGQCAQAYEKSIQRGGVGTGILRTPGRRRVMEVLGRLPSGPKSTGLLEQGLKDTPEVQIPAAAALVKAGDDAALKQLVEATSEVLDENMKRRGLQALRRLAIPRRREVFLNALSAKGRKLLRPVLLQTFPQDGQDRSAALRAVAGDHGNPYARVFALEVLGEQGDPAAVDLARKALDSNDEVVRPTALAVLGSAGGNKAAGELERVLRGNPQDVGAVVRGLYEVGSEEALQRALTLARDDALLVKTRAGVVDGFLARLREPKAPAPYRATSAREAALEALRELLEAEDRKLVTSAAGAIGRIGDSGADVEPLLGLLSDPNPEVGKAVVAALGRLGGVDAAAKLVSLLEGDSSLRADAAAAFAFLPRARDVPVGAVIDMLEDDRLEVRTAAFEALKNLRRTKDAMGYDPGARESARELGVQRWRKWWDSRRGG